MGSENTVFASRQTVWTVWQSQAKRLANKEFLRFIARNEPGEVIRSYTYAEFDQDVRDLASRLRRQGLDRGDRIVLQISNRPEFVMAVLASAGLGAIVVPTIVGVTESELRFILDDCGPKLLMCTGETASTSYAAARGAKAAIRILNVDAPIGDHEATVAGEALPSGSTPEDVWLMLYTSGTTSRPKGVMITGFASACVAFENAAAIRLRDDDVSLIALPLFHVNAMFFQLLPAVAEGCTVVLQDGFSASAYFEAVRKNAVTVGNLTNGPLRLLLQRGAEDHRNTSLRLMMYGLPLQREEILSLEESTGAKLSMGWGLTETLASGTRTPLGYDPRHGWQSIGRVSAGWDLAVMSDDGTSLAPGEVGELCLRGPGLMDGYYGDPQGTKEAFVGEWFRTGDLGYVDDDGYVFFVDRKKDVVKHKGENVSAGEVEQVLRKLAWVQDAAVCGVPDAIVGERVVAFLEVPEGVTPDLEAVKALCARELAPFKVPAEFHWSAVFPRTSVGKVRKVELLQMSGRR